MSAPAKTPEAIAESAAFLLYRVQVIPWEDGHRTEIEAAADDLRDALDRFHVAYSSKDGDRAADTARVASEAAEVLYGVIADRFGDDRAAKILDGAL